MTTKEIQLTCDKVRKKYNIIVPVDDGYEIAYKMKGHVRESMDFSDNEIGTIRKYNDSFWIILNGKLSEISKKIIISQLIGVLCLYTPFVNDEEDWKNCPETNIPINEEMLINGYYFAKELLMPEYLYCYYFCKNITITHKINLIVLANIFKLPIEFVRERALDLKMIVPRQNPEKASI